MLSRSLRLAILASAIFFGCQKSSIWDRIPLTGTARLDGADFNGSICFRPTGDNRGPSVTTRVEDGYFEFDRQAGPVQGAHTVILIPPPDPSNRLPYRIDTKSIVPSEEPYSVALEFATPEVDAEYGAPVGAANEGGMPK